METSSLGLWRVLISCMRVSQASEELSPGKEPHGLGWRRPFDLAMGDSLSIISRSTILESVLRRTMMRKEVVES